MKKFVFYLIILGFILFGILMMGIGLTELITKRVLNGTEESDPTGDFSAVLGVVTLLLGLLTWAVVIAGLVMRHNIAKEAAKKCLDSILENLPDDWDCIKVSGSDSLRITEEVANLFTDTWQYTERIGRDATNLDHDGLKIRSVCIAHKQRHILEHRRNSERFKQQGFQQQKGRLMRLQSTKGQAEPLTWSSELGAEIHNLDSSFPGTCKEINEIYLFHGTKKGSVKGILNDGFSLEKSSDGLYGKALYFAESTEKSDQYTDRRNDRQTEGLCMLLVRVALGRIYIHDDKTSGKSKLNALPCTETGCFTPGCDVHELKYHGAVAGMGKRFREFLLYDSLQCYPHVLVFYDRINEGTQKTNGVHSSSSDKCNIPCYIIGPTDEVQHFKQTKSRNNVSPAYCLINETIEPESEIESCHFDGLFDGTETPTSVSEIEEDTKKSVVSKEL